MTSPTRTLEAFRVRTPRKEVAQPPALQQLQRDANPAAASVGSDGQWLSDSQSVFCPAIASAEGAAAR